MTGQDAAEGSAGEFLIRPMVEADLDRVVEIAKGLPEAPHWSRSAYLAAISRSGALRGLGIVACGQDTNAVSGFVVGSVLVPDAELELIAVDREAQGQEIGRGLLAAFEADVQRKGAEQILLEVRSSNARAINFYRRNEFRQSGRRIKYYSDPVEDAILMKKQCNLLAG